MNDHGFIAFLFDTMLHEHFGTKRNMARILGIELRTLQIFYSHMGESKGASRAFESMIMYCLENKISIDDMYRRFQRERFKLTRD